MSEVDEPLDPEHAADDLSDDLDALPWWPAMWKDPANPQARPE